MKASAGPFFSGDFEMRLSKAEGGRRLETRTTARFIGVVVARSRTVSLLDPANQPIEHLSISKKRGRRYLFGEREYTVSKFESPDGPDGPSERWVTRTTQQHLYTTVENRDVRHPFDYFGMLLRLRDEKLERLGDEVVLPVATTKGPLDYRVTVGELRSSERSFRTGAAGKRKTVTVREMRLRIVPDDPALADQGFMNMEGETELWVEARSKAPIEIRGDVPGVAGKVVLTLAELD